MIINQVCELRFHRLSNRRISKKNENNVFLKALMSTFWAGITNEEFEKEMSELEEGLQHMREEFAT